MARLCTVPQVGPVTACAFVAAVDDPERFDRAHQVEAYLGLVPSERSSGEKQRKGRITKAGNDAGALAAGAGGRLAAAAAHPGDGAPASMGRADCRAARQEDSRRGAGATGWPASSSR